MLRVEGQTRLCSEFPDSQGDKSEEREREREREQRAGKMAQHLRALVALSEDLVWFPALT